jgi:4-hydroxy-tetrahydrodipicolinate synthase
VTNRIKGSLVALVTPMHADGRLDLDTFDRLIDWHVDAGTDGIVVVGTTGESATLSTEEHCDLVAHCVKSVNGRIPVIAGTGSNNTQEALYQHFKYLAESVDIPQILYNVPGRTACDLSLETVKRLTEVRNIVGIKDATGNLERGLELIRECGNRIAVYSGEDAISLKLLAGGGDGVISVSISALPPCTGIYSWRPIRCR